MAEHGDGDPMTRLLERAPPADPLARRELLREVERGLFGRQTPLPHVGRYRLVRRIGAGGQGVVYVAHDPELDRHVALKLLLSGHAGDEARPGRSLLDARAGEPQDAMPPRLRREAQAMAKLSHPNVAAVYEVGWHDDTAFIAMELDALLRWLERPDANVVNAAATAVASLPRPEICVDEARLRRQEAPPVDPELREHVVAVRARLAHVRAAIEVARYDDALGEAEAVLKEASSEWPALVAQTKLLIGLAQQELGRYDDAHAALQEAFFTAGAAGRDDIAADAATVLVTVTGRLGRDAEGLQWGRLAQMLIDRSGQPDDGALLDNMGLAHHRLGDHTRALELVEQALVVRQNALGEGHPAVAAVLDSVAVVRTARGEHALALEASERALAIREETLGPGHPEVIDARKRRAEAESWLRERRNR